MSVQFVYYKECSFIQHLFYHTNQFEITVGAIGFLCHIQCVGRSISLCVLYRVNGLNIGKDINEKTNIYLKANLMHEFGGGYNASMVDAGGTKARLDRDFDDTWFEYGIGAALKTGSNSHIYIDVERSSGSDFKKDWQWNAGARWTF